jgi:hypothetical protein
VRRQVPAAAFAELGRLLVLDCVELLVCEHGYTKPATPKGNGAETGESADWSGLLANIIAGHELHDSTRNLAAKLVASGMADAVAVRLIRGALENSAVPRDDRFAERIADVPRAVSSARAKFSKPQHQPAQNWNCGISGPATSVW